MAKNTTPVVESDSDIANRRAQVIKELLKEESCADVIKNRCMKIAKQVAESIMKVMDCTTGKYFLRIKIGEKYKSMPVEVFTNEINGLKNLVRMMIQVFQQGLKQQPQPAV